MRAAVALALVGLVASTASAGIVNGNFASGLTGWGTSGQAEIHNPGDFGIPASPSGGPFAGAITSWGGNWGGPQGMIMQNVTGLLGPQTLTGEIYAAAHSGDLWRNTAIEVVWNGSVVASLARDGSQSWAADFPWVSFTAPVTATGSDMLVVQWTAHFAEWTWMGVDNLAITPEPASIVLLGLAALFIRRR